MVNVEASSQQVGLLPRILITMVICAAATPMLYICFKALVGIRKMPHRRMTHRQVLQVSGILGVWIVLMAVGAVIGYLSATNSAKGAGALGGLLIGAFAWLILCWLIGGIARTHHARQNGISPSVSKVART